MSSPLLDKSKAFALEIIKVCNAIKSTKKETVLTNAVRLSKNVIPRRKATRPRAVSLVMRTIHLLGIRPKPPLCKGRWHGEAVTEGLSQRNMSISARFSANSYCSAHNPSVSLAADSSPYSGEP